MISGAFSVNWGDFQAGFAAGNVLVFPPQINVLQAKKKFEILDAVRALWVPSVAAGRAALDPWHCPGAAGMPKMGAGAAPQGANPALDGIFRVQDAAFPALCPQQSGRKDERDKLLWESTKRKG